MACYLEPENPDTFPPDEPMSAWGDYLPCEDQDDEIEDEYVCPIHGPCDPHECPRC